MSTTSTLTYQYGQDGVGRYPFTDASTMSNGSVTIPAAMFVDAVTYVPGGGERQFLSALAYSDALLSATVSDDTGELASGSVDPNGSERQIALTDAYGRQVGSLVLNADKSQFASLPHGTYAFPPDATELVPTCVLPQPQEVVRGFLTAADNGNEDFVSGDVWLVGKDGVVLEVGPAGEVVANVVGDPLFVLKSCQATAEPNDVPPIPIKRINLVFTPEGEASNTPDLVLEPDGYGNVSIVGGSNQHDENVIRVEPIIHGILLKMLGSVMKTGHRRRSAPTPSGPDGNLVRHQFRQPNPTLWRQEGRPIDHNPYYPLL